MKFIYSKFIAQKLNSHISQEPLHIMELLLVVGKKERIEFAETVSKIDRRFKVNCFMYSFIHLFILLMQSAIH